MYPLQLTLKVRENSSSSTLRDIIQVTHLADLIQHPTSWEHPVSKRMIPIYKTTQLSCNYRFKRALGLKLLISLLLQETLLLLSLSPYILIRRGRAYWHLIYGYKPNQIYFINQRLSHITWNCTVVWGLWLKATPILN